MHCAVHIHQPLPGLLPPFQPVAGLEYSIGSKTIGQPVRFRFYGVGMFGVWGLRQGFQGVGFRAGSRVYLGNLKREMYAFLRVISAFIGALVSPAIGFRA